MSKKFIKIITVVAACLLLATSAAFAANSVTKNVNISYQGIKLVVDGVKITPKDANGGVVEPFIYNGTTYLPVRAVGDAVGKQVTWDGVSKTVYLGEAPGQVSYLINECPAYESNNYYTPETFDMGGKAYANGFCMYTDPYAYALFNLNGEYSTLEFDIGHKDGSNMDDGKYNIYLDGQYSQTIEAGAEDSVTHVVVPLNYALKLKITGTDGTIFTSYGFANAKLS